MNDIEDEEMKMDLANTSEIEYSAHWRSLELGVGETTTDTARASTTHYATPVWGPPDGSQTLLEEPAKEPGATGSLRVRTRQVRQRTEVARRLSPRPCHGPHIDAIPRDTSGRTIDASAADGERRRGHLTTARLTLSR